jgi:regulator of protease activity HflC (stomatin/prohibitin superfamily)
VRVITEPGLNAKIPFIDSVIYIDKRILNIESPAQEVIASSQDKANAGVAQAGERLVVDAFAPYRITDPLKFYQTVGPEGASSQLSILLNSALRRVLGAARLADAVRNRREDLMAQMRDQLDRDAQPFGIQVVDVRIRRVDLPEQNSQAVYQRMQTERQREAAEFRAQGSQKSQEIRARADRDVTVLLAEANSQAEAVRAMPNATASLPTLMARMPTSSASTAPCRPTSAACSIATRIWCCGRTPISSVTSAIRAARRRRRTRPRPARRPGLRRRQEETRRARAPTGKPRALARRTQKPFSALW